MARRWHLRTCMPLRCTVFVSPYLRKSKPATVEMGNPKFNTKLGQHILKNPGIIDTIMERAGIKPSDTILEVGGGTGMLSLKLLPKCAKLICYEKDIRLAAELVKKVNAKHLSHKFELNVGDALRATFPPFDMCISNIPYQISGPLVFKLLQENFKCAYIMFQREFAQRLIARPGSSEYSRLSVAVQLLAKVHNVMNVSRNSFVPPPMVDSSVVRIEPRVPRPPINIEEFNRLLKICFLRKNKRLSGIFKRTVIQNMQKVNSKYTVQEIEKKTTGVLRKLSTDRAAKMDIEDFLFLLLEFKKEGINF